MNKGPKIQLRKAEYLNLRYGKKDMIFITKRNRGLVLIHVMKTKLHVNRRRNTAVTIWVASSFSQMR
jgi:hypothetical protein